MHTIPRHFTSVLCSCGWDQLLPVVDILNHKLYHISTAPQPQPTPALTTTTTTTAAATCATITTIFYP